MSGWGFNLFGGGSSGGTAAAKKNAPKEAILKLRSTLEMLSKREKHLQNLMDEQDALARKYISTNKTGELGLLPSWWRGKCLCRKDRAPVGQNPRIEQDTSASRASLTF
jgi:hypothetical protein